MLRIGGITPFSTVDWPGKLCCVAFLAGCPWRCPYCQNHELQQARAATQDESSLFALLEQRRGLLDGVIFSGGEPLAQEGVLEVARRVRELGFVVGLHTCGAYPERLRELLPYLAWVGLDVKAPWHAYDRITQTYGTAHPARESLEVLLHSSVEFEVRTTWHPDLLTPDDVSAIGEELAIRGVRKWAIQAYRSMGTTGELANKTVYPFDVPSHLPQRFDQFEFRRA